MFQYRSLYLTAVFLLWFVSVPVRADEIHELIEQKAFDKVKALLDNKPEVKNARDKMRLTPLHSAVLSGDVEIVKYLLELKVDVNAKAYNNFTPLHFADDPKIIKLLADHKADLEAESAAGTPLHHAAYRVTDGDTSDYAKKGRQMSKALLEAGAKYDILSASLLGDLDRVKMIVKADPRAALSKNAMRAAAREGHVAIVQFLLDNKGDPNDADWGGMTVLYFSLKHPDVVMALIKAGADVKTPLSDTRSFATGPLPHGSTILHIAAEVGVTETVKLLIEAGAEVGARDPRGATPLRNAAYAGWPDVVKLLHQNKASIMGDDGVAALRAATGRVYYSEQDPGEVKRFKAVITYLVKEGVSTELRTAIVLDDLQLVKKLVKQNPPWPEKLTRHELPLLHLAVGLNQEEIVAALLEGGAPIEGTRDSGGTALHEAAFWWRAKIAKLLIDRGAKLSAVTGYGSTPLHEAARCGKLDAARVLIAAGAEVNARDSANSTPLGRVKSTDQELTELLKKHGGK